MIFIAVFVAAVARTWGNGFLGVVVPFVVGGLSVPTYLLLVLILRRHFP